jgi:hypothetical protein
VLIGAKLTKVERRRFQKVKIRGQQQQQQQQQQQRSWAVRTELIGQ